MVRGLLNNIMCYKFEICLNSKSYDLLSNNYGGEGSKNKLKTMKIIISMTLFLLRHEKRFSEPTFFTSLTDEGLKDSELLTKKFNEIKPDIILCSPFLRCIQTIYPYISQSDKKINIEYSLYEFMDNPIFTNKNYKHQVSELYNKYPKFKKIINEDYMSYLTSEQIKAILD